MLSRISRRSFRVVGLVGVFGLTAWIVADTTRVDADEGEQLAPLEPRVYSVGDLTVWRPVGEGVLTFDAKMLVALIKVHVEPTSWDTAGCVIAPQEATATLVIRQTFENHRRIATMLERLRRGAAVQNDIEPAQSK